MAEMLGVFRVINVFKSLIIVKINFVDGHVRTCNNCFDSAIFITSHGISSEIFFYFQLEAIISI